MPMFSEDDDLGRRKSTDSALGYPDSAPIAIQTLQGVERWFARRLSEESIRTDLCEGLIPDSPPRPVTPQQAVPQAVCDRAELIERLKRGESPTWIPNRHLESLFQQTKAASPPRTPKQTDLNSSSLLPAPTITPEKQDASLGQQDIDSSLQQGLSIERPRSALHSGNFTPVELSPNVGEAGHDDHDETEGHFRSARDLWMSTSPPRDFTPFNFTQGAASYRREAFKSAGPSSLSSSLSSNFVYQPPTSPLVQSEVNEDLDLTLPLHSFNIDANSPRNTRRHTLNFSHSPFSNAASHRQSSLRRESTHPYQAHQPRRSLNSTPNFPFTGTSPQTPAFFRSRRPSIGSEASPLQHASMVGSYEESILRGRMSTTPSKPLEFNAQIGVLGLGKCKASLRCPAHVTLPFSAVFYNYASTSSGRSKMEDGPSPYVGQIDLENGLPNPEEGQRAKRKLQSRFQDLKGAAEEGPPTHESPVDTSEGDSVHKNTKAKRPSRTPKTPPGGGYRIPEKGQLQIIIKNPNKTAVKLFLVPYDLAGMEPGTKTFIRQRSYSAGPIIEAEVPATKDGPAPGADRPTLRYLIHLHICCPSKGRYYLYKSIRVVFANRVPDGKERLRNEVTYPDPRFTPYKPTRVMHPPPLGSSHVAGTTINNSTPASASLAAERAFRRRSVGFHGHHLHHSPLHHHHYPMPQRSPDTHFSPALMPATPAILPDTQEPEVPTPDLLATTTTTPAPMTGIEMTGRSSSNTTPPLTQAPTPTTNTYGKLNRGDIGYGGHASVHQSGAVAESLLSKRLRSLGVQPPSPPPPPLGDQEDNLGRGI